MKLKHKISASVLALCVTVPSLAMAWCGAPVSPASNVATTITFKVVGTLQEENSFVIYNVDTAGNPIQRETLWGGQEKTYPTMLNHTWIVAMPIPGTTQVSCYPYFFVASQQSGNYYEINQ